MYVEDTCLLDTHAPTKEKKLTHKPVKWFTPEVKEAKMQKCRLERKQMRTKTPLDRSNYRRQVNKFNTLLASAKRTFYTKLIQENSDDSKKMWKSLNSVLHRGPKTILPDCSEDLSLAEKFSEFFVNKISRIWATFPAVSSQMVPPPHSVIPNFSAFENVSTEDVRKIITASPTQSCSLGPWPTFLVKDCLDILKRSQ